MKQRSPESTIPSSQRVVRTTEVASKLVVKNCSIFAPICVVARRRWPDGCWAQTHTLLTWKAFFSNDQKSPWRLNRTEKVSSSLELGHWERSCLVDRIYWYLVFPFRSGVYLFDSFIFKVFSRSFDFSFDDAAYGSWIWADIWFSMAPCNAPFHLFIWLLTESSFTTTASASPADGSHRMRALWANAYAWVFSGFRFAWRVVESWACAATKARANWFE